MTAKVSVIVAIYNVETYLSECIESILAQTFSEIEIILVDDGSPDNSGKICDEYAAKDERIRVIHQENAGVSVARNHGIEAAKGEYLMFVDADDWLESTFIETLLQYMDDSIDIISCCCTVFDETFETPNYFWKEDKIFEGEEKNELQLQLMQLSYGQPGRAYTAIGVPWGKLYRRALIQKNHLEFHPNLKRMQDNIFNMYAFAAARRIKYMNLPIYHYRYDHIVEYSRAYKPDYATYILALCEERYQAVTSLHLLQNEKIRGFFYREILHWLFSILITGLFHQNQKKYFRENVRKANQICKMECFQILYQEKFPLTKKEILMLHLIKGHHYRCIQLWGKIGFYRRKRRQKL